MWKALLGFLVLAVGPTVTAAGAQPEDDVRAVLARQEQNWNRGNVKAFMEGYDQSEGTTFVGTSVSRGYSKVLARYLKRYPNRESMGSLTFSNVEVTMLGKDYASVLGHWHLDRKTSAGGPTGGFFTLLLRETPRDWKIFLDHTSVE